MLFIRMLAQALKIIGPMCRYIIKAFALTFGCFTSHFFILGIQVLMILKAMITKTFSLRANHFTLNIFDISPTQIQSVLTLLGNWQQIFTIHYVQLLVLFQFDIRNHFYLFFFKVTIYQFKNLFIDYIPYFTILLFLNSFSSAFSSYFFSHQYISQPVQQFLQQQIKYINIYKYQIKYYPLMAEVAKPAAPAQKETPADKPEKQEKVAPGKKKEETEEQKAEKAVVNLGPQNVSGHLFAVCHILATWNDTFIHVTDLTGRETLARVTGGMKVKSDRDQSSPYAAMLAAIDVVNRLKQLKITAVHIRLRARGGTGDKAPGPGAQSALRAIARNGIKIGRIEDVTPTPTDTTRRKGGRKGRRL